MESIQNQQVAPRYERHLYWNMSNFLQVNNYDIKIQPTDKLTFRTDLSTFSGVLNVRDHSQAKFFSKKVTFLTP